MNKTLSITLAVCAAVLTIAISIPVFMLWPAAARLEKASSQLLDCTYTDANGHPRGNAACLQSQTLAITGSVRATMGEVAKSAPDIAKSIRAASANSVAASRQTTETAQSANELLKAARGTITELDRTLSTLNTSIASLTQDAHALLAYSDKSVQAAGRALEQLTVLEAQLNKQIESGAPEATATLAAMHRILEDPAIIGTLKNIESGTANVSEVTRTFDLATRGLRKKAGQVKWVLEKVAGMLKFTFPLL